jgi:hypothetical protein
MATSLIIRSVSGSLRAHHNIHHHRSRGSPPIQPQARWYLLSIHRTRHLLMDLLLVSYTFGIRTLVTYSPAKQTSLDLASKCARSGMCDRTLRLPLSPYRIRGSILPIFQNDTAKRANVVDGGFERTIDLGGHNNCAGCQSAYTAFQAITGPREVSAPFASLDYNRGSSGFQCFGTTEWDDYRFITHRSS